MKDLFVSHELSVLAKEKGFEKECLGFFSNKGYFSLVKSGRGIYSSIYTRSNKDKSWVNLGYEAAPMYQQLVDWFREDHKLTISIVNKYEMPNEAYYASIKYIRKTNIFTRIISHEIYPFIDRGVYETGTYYEALNEALLQAFRLI